MKRKTSLKRKTRLPRVNRERAAKRKARDFGPFADFVRQQMCVLFFSGSQTFCHIQMYQKIGEPMKLSEAAHVKSRGAGGHADANLVALCTGHHAELHRIGRKSFEKKHAIQLGAIAADLWGRYQEERGAA